jgi:hypothetical protein
MSHKPSLETIGMKPGSQISYFRNGIDKFVFSFMKYVTALPLS